MGDMVMDNKEEKQEIPESLITIKFAYPGSVNMSIEFKNVIPLQVAAAAWYLEKQAEAGFFQQQMEQQQNKISVPTLQPKKDILRP
jgi:hypothetical protein